VIYYPQRQADPDIQHKILGITVTEQCNLKCAYCYQVERRNQKKNLISFESATSAIEDHLSRDDQFKEVIIELIGGEVFLYADFVKRLVDWTLQRRDLWRKDFRFFIDTNGTLLTDELKEWLTAQRKHVTVGLSLDGTPEAHDLNRCNSYAQIAPHIQFFAKTWPHQPVKMTISPNTIPMIFEGVLDLMAHGFLVAANVPMEDIWGSSQEKVHHVESFRREIVKLVDFFSTRVEKPLPSLIDIPIWAIMANDRDRPWCGSGKNMVGIDVTGRTLPCIRYASMSFDQSLFDKPIATDRSRCRYCCLKPACQTCEALNWEVNGNPVSRTSFHCEFTKWQAWGTAQVHAVRLERRFEEIKAMSRAQKAAHVAELVKIRGHLDNVAFVLEEFERDADFSEVGMQTGWREESKSAARAAIT
jgi:sulfatase maturation enzyme AslB (radical SAM superfamily)